MTNLTLADQMFLLLTKADGHRVSVNVDRGWGAAAGALVDLLLKERVRFTDEKRPHLVVLSSDPADDAALDSLLAVCDRHHGKPATEVFSALTDKAEAAVGASLVAKGLVDDRTRLLGAVRLYPQGDTAQAAVAALRTGLTEALEAGHGTPDEVAILGLMAQLRMIDHAVAPGTRKEHGWSTREAAKRAQGLAMTVEDGATQATRQVAATMKALTATLAASGAAASAVVIV